MMFGNGYNNFNSCIAGFGHMHGGAGIFMIFALILMAACGAILAALLIRRKKFQPESGILDELKLRYVKGEITEEEYVKRKNLLNL